MGKRGRNQTKAGPLRRGGRRIATGKLGDKAKQMLLKTQQQQADGQHDAAAEGFREMASIAANRDMPRVALHLATRQAYSLAKGGNKDAFHAAIDNALDYAKRMQNPDRAARSIGKLVSSLSDSPMADEAGSIGDKARAAFGMAPKTPAPPTVNRAMRRGLPKGCATCGISVKDAEPEWNEDLTANCTACGSLLGG